MKPHARAIVRSARAGFTLIEILLTLLIMSGIMIAMTSILTAARTSRDTIHNIQETQLAGPAILDMIERDLRGITVFARTKALQLRIKDRVVLGFDADSLDFVTTTRSMTWHQEDNRFVRAASNEVGYRLKIAAGGDQFLELYRREQYGVDQDAFEGGNFLLLHDKVRGLDIRCFMKDGPDEEPVEQWGSDDKDENVGLPSRIEISLTLELAPRLVHEQLRVASLDKRTIVYKRIIRFPESIRVEETDMPAPKVPALPAPTPAAAGAGAGGGGGGGTKPARSGDGAQSTTTASDAFNNVPSAGGAANSGGGN